MDWTEYWAKAKEREGKAIAQYLTVLQRVYPTARGTASVHIRPDHRIIVSVPLPKSSRERMRLFDRMAEVGTKLLLETDEYIILSGR